MPKFSVIIPCHNRVDDLRRALRSCADQTFRDFEVVVCDDGSTENVPAVISEFSGQLSVTCIRISASGGPARPRNEAMSVAKGEWFALLDSDDWWMPARLDQALEVIAKNPDCSVFYERLIPTGISGDETFKYGRVGYRMLRGDALVSLLAIGNSIPNSAGIFRAEVYRKVGLIDESYPVIQDYEYWCRIAVHGYKFHYTDRACGYYWISGPSVSKNLSRHVVQYRKLYCSYHSALPSESVSMCISLFRYTLAGVYMSRGEWARALVSYRKAGEMATARLRIKRLLGLVRALFNFIFRK